MSRKILIVLAILASIVLVTVYSNSKSNQGIDDVIRVATLAEPKSLDPAKTTGVWEARVLYALFEGLVVQDENDEIVPGVAKSWSISKDLKTYTFKLRKDAKWSDGEPLNAHDFVYTMRRLVDPKTAATVAYMLYWVENGLEINKGKKDVSALGVKALDDYTLQIKLSEPNSFFLSILASCALMPVPKHLIESNNWIKGGLFVSNGPYVISSRVPKQHIKADKNPYYWDNKNVSINHITYYTQDELHTLLKRYKNGEIDILYDFDTNQIDSVKRDFSDQLSLLPYSGMFSYAINSENKELNNIKVRQALSMAIDRERIVSSVLKDTGETAAYGVIKDIANYKHVSYSWQGMSQGKKTEMAKKLMKEAGFSEANPLTVELKYVTSENQKKIAVAISDMWKKIGVKVLLYNQDSSTHFSDVMSGNFQVAVATWTDDFFDPYAHFNIYMSDSVFNFTRMKSDEYSKLVVKASQSSDIKLRNKIYHKAEKIILDGYYMLPIYYYSSHTLVAKRVKGFKPVDLGYHKIKYLSLDN